MRATVLAGVLALSAGVGSAQAQSCDRACLTTVLDSYIIGVIRHDPKQAPLAAGYRGTENAAQVKAGDGLWKTMTGLGAVQRRYLDPVSGQAAYFGIIDDAGGPIITSLRVKVVGRKVTEAEWVLGKRTDALFSPAGLIAEPPSDKPVPKEKQVSRERLQIAANSYFNGLQGKDGSLVEHHAGCIRLENGTKVTQRTGGRGARPAPAAPGVPANELSGNDCAGGLERFSIREVAHRRFPVIDEEAQVALGTGMFLRPPGSATMRLLLSEYFVTTEGKIDQIYAAMHYLTAEAPETTGW